MQEQEKELARQEEELLGLYLMGDIREDAEVFGMKLKDLISIMVLTLGIGLLPFLLPLPTLFKICWVLGVFVIVSVAHLLRMPYRLRRLYIDKRYQKAKGIGASLEDLLGMQEDGWFYTSKKGNVIQILYEIKAPPWATSTLGQKRIRIQHNASFIRACLKEKFRIDLFSEQIPNYQHEIWDRKQAQKTASLGIEKLKHDRIAMWSNLVENGEAKRSVYVLRLTIHKSDLAGKQREDEPADLSKEELKRYRMVAELREKQARVLSILEQSGHSYSLLSGYALTELLARAWDYQAWRTWKNQRGDWAEELHEEPERWLEAEQEAAVASTDIDEDATLSDVSTDKQAVKEKRHTRVALMKLVRRIGTQLARLIHRVRALRWRKKPVTVVTEATTEQHDIPSLEEGMSAHVEANDAHLAADQVAHDNMSLQQDRPHDVSDIRHTSTAQDATVLGAHADRLASPREEQLWLLTSPAATGKSFLCINVAVAMSSYDQPVHVVDLSPDQGCKTLLNPLPMQEEHEGWRSYLSKHAPGLTLWLPEAEIGLDPNRIRKHLQELAQSALTLVELPWHYPDHAAICTIGQPIAIVDSDYHHWLMWERVAASWSHPVWLNGMDQELEKVYSALITEAGWSPAYQAVYPFVAQARTWSYQGVPAAAMAADAFRMEGVRA